MVWRVYGLGEEGIIYSLGEEGARVYWFERGEYGVGEEGIVWERIEGMVWERTTNIKTSYI